MADQEDPASRLAAIRERLEKATEGPWQAEESFGPPPYNTPSWSIVDGPDVRGRQLSRYVAAADNSMDDAEFIAHARQDVPYLLDQFTQQAASLASLTQECEELRKLLRAADPLALSERLDLRENRNETTPSTPEC